jgi:hypothetical protein
MLIMDTPDPGISLPSTPYVAIDQEIVITPAGITGASFILSIILSPTTQMKAIFCLCSQLLDALLEIILCDL